jgi:hypothetical protein
LARSAKVFFDLGCQNCKVVFGNWSALACAANANDYLVATKWFSYPIALNNVERDGFVRGEPAGAFRAFTTATNT